ncbi:MAG: bifunctional UDP-3-O-[3-hydroxymyristoyl] N-acetylglucosamine deacetylase/3-hydroxyacyl-ACP dehydratase [Verrucomicrobiales bacterium]|nr:bifunctional UDP-3-O-[3-hydroxymyristoyl] N-acetylglucosamine deacetylase/3-hydroxyacyl-ACP dehydratase [Verrucomicrobiales bacterium]
MLQSQQQTLKEAAGFSGVGLHSGNRVSMRFLPAPANTGIRFRRVDLDGQPEIEALVDHVGETARSTTLAKGNIRIHTVEHVLATFAGLGVDNAIVELDANEPPIGDGSAREYTRLVETAGLEAQDAVREPVGVSEPVEVQAGETLIAIFPHDRFKISCTSSDRQGRHTQFFSVELSPETWRADLADARTFCFYEEIEALIRGGLIKGGTLENAVVIRDDAVLTTEPLRYPEEFVRHKILDIVGDLSLLGRPLRGHVVAVRPSHGANCELARRIQARLQKPLVAAQAFTPPPEPPPPAAETGGTRPSEIVRDGCRLEAAQVMQVLPHRYPFLMVDRVLSIDGAHIVGQKNITSNEPCFQGHFPGHPIFPGVLQLEAIAQVAGILTLQRAECANKLAYFMSAESVKWRKPVRPGDTLVIDVTLTKSRGKIGKAKGVCLVNGETVSEAEVTFMMIDR